MVRGWEWHELPPPHTQGSWRFPKPFQIYPSPWKRGTVLQGCLSGRCTHRQDGVRVIAPRSLVLQPGSRVLAAKRCPLTRVQQTQGWQPAPPHAPLALLTHTPARIDHVPWLRSGTYIRGVGLPLGPHQHAFQERRVHGHRRGLLDGRLVTQDVFPRRGHGQR